MARKDIILLPFILSFLDLVQESGRAGRGHIQFVYALKTQIFFSFRRSFDMFRIMPANFNLKYIV